MAEPAQIIFDKVDRMECPSCHAQIDVGSLQAFTQAICPSCGSEVTVPGRLGNYLLLNCLGSGGMGSVYRAYDETLARIVAIKVMLRSLGDAPEFLESFRREAQAAAKLNHPNIAQIYSFGQEKGQPYIVMELVGGQHFDEMIAQPEPLDQALVMKIGMDIADGLQLAAASNLIHGDIKPENILLDERNTAKLLDFGIASSPNAQTTEIWGTPYYIAPEKLKRQRVDFRSDIYCLGGTLYHALTQHPPFEGEDAIAVVKARLEHPPEPMKTYRPDIDPEVVEIIDRMLQVEPAMRYPTYGSLLSDMRRYLSRVQPQMPSPASSSNKRIVIKGRGKGAGSASPGSSTGAPSGKHHIAVSRGMVDPKTITASHTLQTGEDGATGAHGKMIGEEESSSGGGKAAKGCLIAAIVGFVLLLLAGGGAWYFFSSQNKKAVAEYAAEVGRRDTTLSQFKALKASAEKLRDETMPAYLGEAQNIVSQAIASVEAEVENGASYTARIIHEDPEPKDEDLPPEEAAEAEGDQEAREGEAEDKAEDAAKAEDGDKTEEGAGEEAKEGDAAEKAEDAPAEAPAEASEGEGAEDGAAEAASDEPPLEGIPLLAREVFEALAPVRRANRQTIRVCDQVTMAVANAEAAAQKIANAASGKTSDIREETQAAAGVVATLQKDLATTTALYGEANTAVTELQNDIRKAKAKLNELLGETSKLAAERKRKAEEEEKARLAQEAEAARQAEAQRIAQEKTAQIGKVIQTAAANLENLRAFKYDQVIRELNRLEDDLTYPESKKALAAAVKRIECMKGLKAFLIERMAEIPFVHPSGAWSVKEATDRHLEIAFRNKPNADFVTWDKLKLAQMVSLISFYLDNDDNAKSLKLRQRVDALRDAAVYYMTFAADNAGAQAIVKKYIAEIVERLPSRAKEIEEILPELKAESDGDGGL